MPPRPSAVASSSAPSAAASSAPVAAIGSAEVEQSCYPIPGRPAPPGCPELSEDHDNADVDPKFAIDDGVEPDDDDGPAGPEKHPLAGVSDAELEQRIRKAPGDLGPMSVGFPGMGRLYNGVQMPRSDHWQVLDPSHAWGTQETVDYLSRAIDSVWKKYPDSARMVIGHISARNGGPLSPHISHQAGRDIDVGYYFLQGTNGFVTARSDTLDRARTWTFVRTLLKETPIDLVLIDRGLQQWLRAEALAEGDDPDWVKQVFDGAPGKRAMILHARGHADHIHIRFFNPIAQETGRRCYPIMHKLGMLKPPTKASPPATASTTWIIHRVAKGETLDMIARRYGVTVQQIRAANGLMSYRLRAKQELKIPKTAPAALPPLPAPNRPGQRPTPVDPRRPGNRPRPAAKR